MTCENLLPSKGDPSRHIKDAVRIASLSFGFSVEASVFNGGSLVRYLWYNVQELCRDTAVIEFPRKRNGTHSII